MLAPPPDLVVSSLQIGNSNNTVRTGDTLHVRYIVSNEGAGPSFESYWTDLIVRLSCFIS